ncbi:ANTAR domain-containing protein [Pseudonocardia sp. NPDC049635]|uniref:ANTAR domain-containing protein n=1 Tax=Pseudonocardia sp. NPDC049635 TaxID=3155506 RepID=UPI0033F59C3C
MPAGPYEHLVTGLRAAAQHYMSDPASDSFAAEGLAQILETTVKTTPGVAVGGISVTAKGTVTARAVTGEDVRALYDLQTEAQQGPCLTAVEHPSPDGIVVAHDLASAPDADRWPIFARAAVDHGYRSLLSTDLAVNSMGRVGMTLYAHAAGVFDDATRTVAGLSAVQAALVLDGAERTTHLQRALHGRDLIGQAKGILMERHGIDADEAFQMLVSASQDTNVRLPAVARFVTDEATAARRDPPRTG